MVDGVNSGLGTFATEEEARDAYAAACEEVGRDPNPREQRLVNKTSKHRGVAWSRTSEKWEAEISVEGKRQHLGLFDDEDDAARVYAAACREAGRDPDPAQSSAHRGVSWNKLRGN